MLTGHRAARSYGACITTLQADFLPWLARDVASIVAKAEDRSPADDLWALALEALAWLRSAPAAQRNAAMAAVKQYLATGVAGDVAIP